MAWTKMLMISINAAWALVVNAGRVVEGTAIVSEYVKEVEQEVQFGWIGRWLAYKRSRLNGG
jgi:hypothetical protein